MKLLTQEEFESRWSAVHGGAEIKGAVAWWLSISYHMARTCSALRISPNFLTLLGLLTAAAMAFSDYAEIALLLLVTSLIFDGIDGSVAIVQQRESNWGSLLDSLADRISEAFWLYMGWKIGIPAWIAISMWAVASIQEYARARLASLGHHEIGVVTPTERPVRASFMAIALLIFIFELPGLEVFSYLFLGALIYSFLRVMRVTFLILR
jgi:phosphatidylglycerophosphate synthase